MRMDRNKPVLLLAKTDLWSGYAIELAELYFPQRLVVARGTVGEPTPATLTEGSYSAILSFLSPWVVPDDQLQRTALAINFHPGSTSFPGIGCYNFALYEEAEVYGAVCHYMASTVDTGSIIEERLFSTLPYETVASLKFRTMVVMLAMFHDHIGNIAQGNALPVSGKHWTRKPFSRKQLNDLGKLTHEMSEHEIKRRSHAVAYPGYPSAKFVEDDMPADTERAVD